MRVDYSSRDSGHGANRPVPLAGPLEVVLHLSCARRAYDGSNIAPCCEGCDLLLGFNIGVGLKTPSQRVNVRPELGLVFNPGESGVVWSFGVGVSIRSPL